MHDDTPSPHVDHTEEYQNSLPLEEDDIEIIDESELIELAEFYEEVPVLVQDDSKLTFKEHCGAVFCCKIDNKYGLAVSGGEDDKGFIWDMTTGAAILECTGHADSVISAEFNHDSSLVATADMSGIIQVWDVQNKNRIWDFTTSDFRWLQWLPEKDHLMAGTDYGDGWLWDIPSGETKIFPSFGVPSSYGTVIDGERVVIGYDDGTIRIWDLNKVAVLKDIVGNRAHNGSITTIDCDQNGLILSGSIDGTAKLILATDGRVVNTFQCGDVAADALDSVESVAFVTNQPSFVTGTLHGSIAVWDIGSHVRKLHFTQETAVVKLICHRAAPLLFTAGLDGVVRLFDGRTGNLEANWKGHVSEILDFDLTSDGQTILTASEDGTCKIFRVGQS